MVNVLLPFTNNVRWGEDKEGEEGVVVRFKVRRRSSIDSSCLGDISKSLSEGGGVCCGEGGRRKDCACALVSSP